MQTLRSFAGEFIGTFIMVFFGVGVVATTVLFDATTGTFQIALVWGVAIALAIFATRCLSNAHFNTAVSLAMCISKRMPWRELPIYIIGQLLGAIAGAAVLFFLVSAAIDVVNVAPAVPSSISKVFVEAYPNNPDSAMTTSFAFAAELFGTFMLVILIFSMTDGANVGRPHSANAPLFIGLIVTSLIAIIGPLTNAGINPARDLGPRIVGAVAGGWSNFAFSHEAILVYIVAPLVAAVLAALVLKFVIEPLTKEGHPTGEPENPYEG
jgi:glycerol uptake facilitator protein